MTDEQAARVEAAIRVITYLESATCDCAECVSSRVLKEHAAAIREGRVTIAPRAAAKGEG